MVSARRLASHPALSSRQPPPSTPSLGSSSRTAASTHPDPLPRASPDEYPPGTYKPTRSERFVFNTPPYSGHIKQFWRFKDEHAARESCGAIWGIFQRYVALDDFIGMDTCRKFIQMGRTRSLRYALRPGGKKYTENEAGERVEMARDGVVHDQGKYDGAQVFKRYEGRCWREEGYRRRWAEYGGKLVPVDGGKSDAEATEDKGQEEKERHRRKEEEYGDERTTPQTVKGSTLPNRRGKKMKASRGEIDGDDTDVKPQIDNVDDAADGRETKEERDTTPIKSEDPPSPLRSVKAEPADTASEQPDSSQRRRIRARRAGSHGDESPEQRSDGPGATPKRARRVGKA